jgi:hypothetical protein
MNIERLMVEKITVGSAHVGKEEKAEKHSKISRKVKVKGIQNPRSMD